MKTSLKIYLVFTFLFGIFALPIVSQASAGTDTPGYVGTKTCGMCHKGEKKGSQLEIWKASKHANAFTDLGTEKAKEVAAKAGVEGNPQENDQCLKCHVTAFGADAALLGARFIKEEGVQCEACHGPGSNYKKKKIMEDRALAVEAGLVVPDEKTCTTCHNEESPTFQEFDFKEYYGKIAHPIPGE